MMPNATLESSAKPSAKRNRVFITKKVMSGFPNVGHKFSEEQFRQLFSLNTTDENHAKRIQEQVDADSYHDICLQRLEVTDTIEEAPPGTEPDDIPASPHNRIGLGKGKNAFIQEAIKSIAEAKAKRAETSKADLADYIAGQQQGDGGRAAIPGEVIPVRRAAGSK